MDIEQTANLALGHHQAGRYAEAEQLYRAILVEQPNHPGVLHMLGLLAHQTGNHEPALQLIRAAIDVDPKQPDFYVNLGTVLGHVGRLDEAILAYHQALSLRPDSPATWNNVGRVFARKGFWPQAVAVYRQAVALAPSDKTARANLDTASQHVDPAPDPAEWLDIAKLIANSRPNFFGKGAGKHRWAIVFVCQRGRIETQAAVLAASLQRFVKFEHELVAALPMPVSQRGGPSAAAIRYLQKIGVRFFGIEDGIDPKTRCLSIATDADRTLFLGSDALVMRPWEEDDRLATGGELDEKYNHPLSIKPLRDTALPVVCQYQDLSVLEREPAAVSLIRQMMSEDPDLHAIVKSRPDWAKIVDPADLCAQLCSDPNWHIFTTPVGEKLAQRGRDLVITGIPRSGTSYLCNLLHRFENCVIVNEPEDYRLAIKGGQPLWRLAQIFRETRRDILLGKPIVNRLKDGKVTEDTAKSNELVYYRPQVSGGDFVLGAKWPTPFLSRIDAIRRVMPDAVIAACVRNPYDTIASWKTTFAHMREAAVERLPVGNPEDPGMTEAQRAELRQIAAEKNLAVRRALWWNHNARLAIANQQNILIIRYPDMVARPLETIEPIVRGSAIGRLREAMEPSTERSKADALDEADIAAIREICSDSARQLGVERETP